jgi:N-acetylmuramoyl-L-alanine amidase
MLTAGKRSPRLEERVTIIDEQDRLLEWQFNMDIRLRIEQQLEDLGVAFMVTLPDHGGYGNELVRRVRNSNTFPSDLPKLFVSIHGNAAPTRSSISWAAESIRGIETWHYSKSPRGKRLASIFQNCLMSELRPYGAKNRGIKHKIEREFYVLKATQMAACLTENFFFNNRFDVALMIREDVRQAIANAHVTAILQIEQHGLSVAFKNLADAQAAA